MRQGDEMSLFWKEILWHQFGAAIEMLQNALTACPEELWQARLWHEAEGQPEFTEFWYVTYHAIFWLDYYCSESADEFTPPPPFTRSELDMDGLLPERVYTKEELRTYLDYARARCRAKIEGLADENEPHRVRENWQVQTVAELLLYTMRHVQEHAAHLSMLLGQQTNSAPGWVDRVHLISSFTVTLRPVQPDDLPIFFVHQEDTAATAMAAFPARSWDEFMAHWARILADERVTTQTILCDGEVAGNIVSFFYEGEREVGYWLGRAFWGRGVATQALAAFLAAFPTRPLFATVAAHNHGSIRVLEKCGFRRCDGPPAPDADGMVRLRLDAGGPETSRPA